MKFAFLGYSAEEYWNAMSPGEQRAMLENCFTYDKKLLSDGHMLADGTALQPSRAAKTLRWQEGAAVVTDGPYAETKERLGGYGLLEARDMAHAVGLMAKHPGLHYGAVFEIRPINEEMLQRHAASVAARRSRVPAAAGPQVRFVALGYISGSGWDSIPPDERDAMLQQCTAFDEARIQNGQWQSGIALEGPHSAKTVRAKAGQVAVTDGPFAETKEYLGGIVILALKDMNEGIALLSKHPALAYGVVMELRPTAEEVCKIWDALRS